MTSNPLSTAAADTSEGDEAGTSADPVVRLEHVWVRIEGTSVLEDVSLAVPRGDYLAIIGPNGSGKSTLLKVILGLLEPSSGRVEVLGHRGSAARGRIGYVPQFASFDLDFPIHVLDVVCMGRLGRQGLFGRNSRDDRDRARRALARVGIDHLARRPIGALSGGQRERVLIARALAVEPELMLLDEPTASVDPNTASSFYEMLAELAKELTIILVSHDVGTVSEHVRSIACLNRRLVSHPSGELTSEMLEEVYGCPIEVVAHGTPHRVLHNHDESGGEG